MCPRRQVPPMRDSRGETWSEIRAQFLFIIFTRRSTQKQYNMRRWSYLFLKITLYMINITLCKVITCTVPKNLRRQKSIQIHSNYHWQITLPLLCQAKQKRPFSCIVYIKHYGLHYYNNLSWKLFSTTVTLAPQVWTITVTNSTYKYIEDRATKSLKSLQRCVIKQSG